MPGASARPLGHRRVLRSGQECCGQGPLIRYKDFDLQFVTKKTTIKQSGTCVISLCTRILLLIFFMNSGLTSGVRLQVWRTDEQLSQRAVLDHPSSYSEIFDETAERNVSRCTSAMGPSSRACRISMRAISASQTWRRMAWTPTGSMSCRR